MVPAKPATPPVRWTTPKVTPWTPWSMASGANCLDIPVTDSYSISRLFSRQPSYSDHQLPTWLSRFKFIKPSSHLEVSRRRCTVSHSSQKTSEIIRVSTAGKIHVANVQDGRQPATTPGPGHNNWVDEARHQKGEDGVGGALHTFRHGATHNGGTSSAKGPLEEPAQPFSGRFNKYLNITKLGFSFEFVFLKS